MKKVLSMVLTIVMLVSIFSTILNLGGVSAESLTSTPTESSGDLTVDLGEIKASPNEYINVPLSFRNVPEKGLFVFDMSISYDPNCLDYLGYETGIIVPDPDLNFYIGESNNGILKLIFCDMDMKDNGVKSDGLVANLKFKVLNKSDISTPLGISAPNFAGLDLKYIISKLVPGKVNISGTPVVTPIPNNEFTVKIGSENALVGDKITIPVTLSNIPSKGITTFDMTIAYDSNKLKFLSNDAGNIVRNPDVNFSMNKPHDGLLKLLFLDNTLGNEAINSNGTLVKLTFKVLDSNNESTSINVTDSIFGDIDINPVNTAIVPGVVNISRPLIQTQTPTPTSTQTSKLTLNIGSAEGKAGDVVRVPISLANVPCEGIHDLYCEFSFDETKLKYMPNESKAFVRGMSFGNDGAPGKANLVFYKINTDNDILINEDGEIAYIAFKILGPYSEATSIKLDYSEFANYKDSSKSLEEIDALINSGSVKIIGSALPTPTPTATPSPQIQINVGSVEGKTGDMVTIPVSFKSVPENGIASAFMALKYDPALLKYISAEAGSIVPNSQICFDKSNPSDGNIRLLYTSDFSDSSYITTDGVFANITFKVLGTYNKSTKISFTDTTVGDKKLNIMPVKKVSGVVDISGTEPDPGFQVEIGSTKGYVGELITIPVSFSHIPTKPIEALDMTLNYDTSMLEYVSYEVGSNVPYPSTNFALNKEPDGKIKMLYLSYTMESGINISVDGPILKLTFKVVSPGESTIYASKAKFLDTYLDEVKAILIPGKISLSEPVLNTEKIGVHSGAFFNFVYSRTSSIIFPIALSNISSTAIKSVSMTVEYDPSKLKYLDAERIVMSKTIGEPKSTKDVTIQKVSENSFKVLYEASVDKDIIKYDGEFAYLYFDVLTPSMNDIYIQIKDVTFTNKYGNPVGAEMLSSPVTEVSIGNVEALEGSTVVVPVKLNSIPQAGVDISEMHIKYDSEVLEYVSYEAGSVMPNPAMCRVDSTKFYDQIILYVDTMFNPITTKGDLGYLTFKVKDGSGFSPIKFEEIPSVLTPSPFLGSVFSRVLVTNGGVKISDEEPIGYTVSGCVYSDLANTNLSKFSFNDGFKVELTGTDFSAVTDSNGYFEIKNVPVGKYTVAITKANCLERRIENIGVDKDKVLSTASNPITLWCGDIEGNVKQDGAINLEDIMQICKVFNTVSGDGKYKENLDLNKDGAINLEDLMIIAKNFNKCSSDYQ